MGESVSDDEIDIGTAGEIPVIRMCGGGKREETCMRQTNKQPVKDSSLASYYSNLLTLMNPPLSRAEKISEPNNELVKGP